MTNTSMEATRTINKAADDWNSLYSKMKQTIERLKMYEATGLEPGEIMRLKDKEKGEEDAYTVRLKVPIGARLKDLFGNYYVVMSVEANKNRKHYYCKGYGTLAVFDEREIGRTIFLTGED